MSELMHHHGLRRKREGRSKRTNESNIIYMLHAPLWSGAVTHPLERESSEKPFHIRKSGIELLEITIHSRTVGREIKHLQWHITV